MTILIIMGLLISSVISSTSDIASRASSRLDANRVARECFDLIGQDLGLVRLPYSTGAVNTGLPVANDNGLQFSIVTKPGGSGNPLAKFRHPNAIFWQAALARNNRYGDLAVVGYFVLKDMSNPDHKRLQLRRIFVEPDAPGAPDANSEYLIYRTPNDWHPNSLLEKFAPDSHTADNANGQRGWVADGVLGLWIRALDPNGNPIIGDAGGSPLGGGFNSRLGYRYNASGTTAYPTGKPIAPNQSTNPRGYAPGAALPAFIEIGLVCIAPQEVPLVNTLPDTSAINPMAFHAGLESYADAVRAANPRLKTVESFSRKYRLYPAP